MRQKNRYEYACDKCDYRSIILETSGKLKFKNIVNKAKQRGWRQVEDDRLICPDCTELETGEAFSEQMAVQTSETFKTKFVILSVSLVFTLSTMVVFSNNKPHVVDNEIVSLQEEEIVEELVSTNPELAEQIEQDPQKFLDRQVVIPENIKAPGDFSILASVPVKTIKEIKQEIETQSEDQDGPLNNKSTQPLKSKTTEYFAKVEKIYTPSYHGRFVVFSSTINNNLAQSARKIGLKFVHVKKLISIFSYNVDFRRLTKNDSFSVVFDRADFEKKNDKAKILAAKFKTRGKSYQRFYYTNSKGKSAYYLLNSKGPSKTITKVAEGVKNSFLRYPLKYNRVSSSFNLRRKHPVNGRIRPHRGTDFAAPKGTKAWSVSNGVVKFAGWQKGYGRVVFVSHQDGKYTTVYAHLNRIARGIKKGKRIRQRQVIGYVGSSGTSTGNHLHYEFRVRGHAVNPLRVRLPKASKIVKEKIIDPKEQIKFKRQAKIMATELKFAGVKVNTL